MCSWQTDLSKRWQAVISVWEFWRLADSDDVHKNSPFKKKGVCEWKKWESLGVSRGRAVSGSVVRGLTTKKGNWKRSEIAERCGLVVLVENSVEQMNGNWKTNSRIEKRATFDGLCLHDCPFVGSWTFTDVCTFFVLSVKSESGLETASVRPSRKNAHCVLRL